MEEAVVVVVMLSRAPGFPLAPSTDIKPLPSVVKDQLENPPSEIVAAPTVWELAHIRATEAKAAVMCFMRCMIFSEVKC